MGGFTGTDEFTIETAPTTTNGQYVLNTDYAGGQGSYESYGYYRYGFNGQEKSDEIKGSGNSYTAEFWEYDPRIGRRWNIDPLAKSYESTYSTLSNNPIYYIDLNGLEPGASHEKPGLFKRIWRAFVGGTHLSRAENYAHQLKSVASEINTIDVDNHTRVIVARFDFKEVSIDEENVITVTQTSQYKFSVFREDRGGLFHGPLAKGKNDDLNLTSSELVEKYSNSKEVMPFPGFPQGGMANGLVLSAQSGSKIYLVQAGARILQNWKSVIRMGVNDADVLNKGFHLHFEGGLELGMKTLQDGKIGLELVGKKAFSVLQIENAVSVFNSAMKSGKFRNELLVRLVASQTYLKEAFKYTKDAQRAIDKAHELNFIIKSLQKW